MLLSSDSDYLRRRRKEKRNELLEERCRLILKKANTRPSFADINNNVSETDLILAIHEELTLNQIYRDYSGFLNAKTKSRKEHLSKLFREDCRRFTSEDLTNYLNNYHNVLKSNPEFYSIYSKLTPDKIRKKRESAWNQYNLLCKKMDLQEKRH